MEPTANEKAETKALREEYEALADEATADADVLREYVLGNVAAERILGRVNKDLSGKYVALRKRNEKLYVKVPDQIAAPCNQATGEYEIADQLAHAKAAGRPIDDETLEEVERIQIEHREADLRRLMKTFADSGDRKNLRIVLEADSNLPLAVQLGFDPDDF